MKVLNPETVTLRRLVSGSYVSKVITASPILMMATEVIPGISVTRVELQDWCIDVADYAFPTTPEKPAARDEIVRASGEVYELASRDQDGPPYRYMTSNHERYRVYTVRVHA